MGCPTVYGAMEDLVKCTLEMGLRRKLNLYLTNETGRGHGRSLTVTPRRYILASIVVLRLAFLETIE